MKAGWDTALLISYLTSDSEISTRWCVCEHILDFSIRQKLFQSRAQAVSHIYV